MGWKGLRAEAEMIQSITVVRRRNFWKIEEKNYINRNEKI